ncbi:MAG: twin-arginine translocation pathway signal protein [Gammaproteobacteria bacterium RIFCSPLOWO2_02_FULL_61_13]|nr:MAG: twin-arginine translocation pathway signal protein [Gammaproteobacteria bacterium RIFCSPLOWO2_02_FULL_61_13]
MPSQTARFLASTALVVAVFVLSGARPTFAADAQLDADAKAALESLYQSSPAAKSLGESAKAILVFPKILKAGFIVGAQAGDGALVRGGETDGYYNIAAASYGLQAGVQSFGYAMFLMTESAVEYLRTTSGFELGVGPSIVVVDAGMANTLSTSTLKSDIYAFTFGQTGLMAGLGLQGTKITKVKK